MHALWEDDVLCASLASVQAQLLHPASLHGTDFLLQKVLTRGLLQGVCASQQSERLATTGSVCGPQLELELPILNFNSLIYESD